METNVHNLPAKRLPTSGDLSLPTLSAKLQPAPVTETVALLTACLALVKPAGMSGEDAQSWLRVAAKELAHLPSDLLADGCAQARRTCTHHGQIVPTIIKATDEMMALRREMVRRAERKPERTVEELFPPWKPEPGELEAIKREVAEKLRAKP
jgi:hypothetical protein